MEETMKNLVISTLVLGSIFAPNMSQPASATLIESGDPYFHLARGGHRGTRGDEGRDFGGRDFGDRGESSGSRAAEDRNTATSQSPVAEDRSHTLNSDMGRDANNLRNDDLGYGEGWTGIDGNCFDANGAAIPCN